MIETYINPGRNAQYAYVIRNPLNDTVLYVGVNTMKNIWAFSDVLKHPEFKANELYQLSILVDYPCDNVIDARNMQSKTIKDLKLGYSPYLNITMHQRHDMFIVCDQTGMKYRSQTEAADALEISQSQLSKHLRKQQGYRSIKGMTFSYVKPEKPSYWPLEPGATYDTPLGPVTYEPVQVAQAVPHAVGAPHVYQPLPDALARPVQPVTLPQAVSTPVQPVAYEPPKPVTLPQTPAPAPQTIPHAPQAPAQPTTNHPEYKAPELQNYEIVDGKFVQIAIPEAPDDIKKYL